MESTVNENEINEESVENNEEPVNISNENQNDSQITKKDKGKKFIIITSIIFGTIYLAFLICFFISCGSC